VAESATLHAPVGGPQIAHRHRKRLICTTVGSAAFVVVAEHGEGGGRGTAPTCSWGSFIWGKQTGSGLSATILAVKGQAIGGLYA